MLKTLDEAQALQQTNEAVRSETDSRGLGAGQAPAGGHHLLSADGAEVSTTLVKVSYSARSREPLTGLKVLVDGRPVSAEGAGQPVKESGDLFGSHSTPGLRGFNHRGKQSSSERTGIGRLRWKGAAAAREEFQIKPKLYVLAVGISQYQDAELRLGLAAKDALDFSSIWTEQKGQLYSGVETRGPFRCTGHQREHPGWTGVDPAAGDPKGCRGLVFRRPRHQRFQRHVLLPPGGSRPGAPEANRHLTVGHHIHGDDDRR